MFGETRFAKPYFQQMILRSKISKLIDTCSKIIDTQLQNNSHSTPFLEWSVNYFKNFGLECHLLKIGLNTVLVLNLWPLY